MRLFTLIADAATYPNLFDGPAKPSALKRDKARALKKRRKTHTRQGRQ